MAKTSTKASRPAITPPANAKTRSTTKTPTTKASPARTKTQPAEPAAPTIPALQALPLDRLMLSKLNVRRTERDADIAALAEDIAARGLKQNLVVIPAHFISGEVNEEWQGTDRWAGKFEVIAGGRRFQAMRILVSDGRLPADHAVPCLVEDRGEAKETSLSENLHKVAMNPADEFEAYQQIIDDRLKDSAVSRTDAVAYTAKRFGVTVSHVEGRLRLAGLAPVVLDALRTGTIGLEAAKAYATTADHDLQGKVFAMHQKEKWRGHNPTYIRSDIRGNTLPLDHAMVQFVGLVTYQAEGGRIEAEMFMGAEGEQRVIDVKLLEKLARKIGEEAVPALAKKEGYQQGLFACGVGRGANVPKCPKGFEQHYSYYSKELTQAELKNCIAVYAIDPEGTGLMRIAQFKPEAKREPATHGMTDEERKALHRRTDIELLAARLAVGKFAGTPLEGRAYWPLYGVPRIAQGEDDDGNAYVSVAVLIRVPVSERDAQLEAAEAQYDAAKQAEAERNAQLDEVDPDSSTGEADA